MTIDSSVFPTVQALETRQVEQGDCLLIHHAGSAMVGSQIGSKLIDRGYQCQFVEQHDLESRLDENEFSCIIIDQSSHWVAFYEFVSGLRNKKSATAIFVLCESNSADNRVRIFNAGADGVLDKPFVFAELVARLDSLHRRRQAVASLQSNALKLDLASRRVMSNMRVVTVTRIEFDLLELLVRNVNRAVSVELLREQIRKSRRSYSWPCPYATAAVAKHMCRLRKKLALCCEDHVLRTVRSEGYILEVKQMKM